MQNPPSAAWSALYRLSSLFGEDVYPLVQRVKEFKDQEASIYPKQERELYLSVKTTDLKNVYNLVSAELGTWKSTIAKDKTSKGKAKANLQKTYQTGSQLSTPVLSTKDKTSKGKAKANPQKTYQTRSQLSTSIPSTQELQLDVPSLPNACRPPSAIRQGSERQRAISLSSDISLLSNQPLPSSP